MNEWFGFYQKRQHGSHIILRCDDPFTQVVVPDHGTLYKLKLRNPLCSPARRGTVKFPGLLAHSLNRCQTIPGLWIENIQFVRVDGKPDSVAFFDSMIRIQPRCEIQRPVVLFL